MSKSRGNNAEKPENKPQGPPPEIKLPFEKKSLEAGEWIYEHRSSVLITVIIYLLIGISFVFSRVVIQYSAARNEIVFDPARLEDMEKLQEELEKARQTNERLQSLQNNDPYEQIRNIISNENATVEELYQSDQYLQEQLRASRDLLERGNEELRLLEETAQGNEEQQVREDIKATGRVTVSFSLRNPVRTAVHLYVPAYRCESGGRVVVNITVNQNGEVVSASVNRSASSSDYCMTTTAEDAARRSRFNVNPGAPSRQSGTITYIFIPQ